MPTVEQVTIALHGLLAGLTLIIAIGSQNVFVLRQGIRREHVGAVVAVCIASDVVLISAGAGGLGALVRAMPEVVGVARWAGVAFLLGYAALAARRALRGGEALTADGTARPARPRGTGRAAAVTTALALTWLNPHVYLDTVILLGSISTRFPGLEMHFALGAMAASFLFFFSLGHGARLLRPLFATPRAWQVLDVVVGITMWVIAAQLVLAGPTE